MLTRNPGFRRETIKNLEVFSKKTSKVTMEAKVLEGGCD